jgi:DNA-binding transcriptional regulator LsrR (DeoR family)
MYKLKGNEIITDLEEEVYQLYFVRGYSIATISDRLEETKEDIKEIVDKLRDLGATAIL